MQNQSFEDTDVQQAYDKNFNECSYSIVYEDDNRPHKRIRLSVLAKHVDSGNLKVALLKSLRQLLELREEAGSSLSETIM